MSNSQSMVGGWSAWNFTLDTSMEGVLSKLTQGLLGVNYKGLAFASQLVNGTNYAILCEASDATEQTNAYPVILHAYAPNSGSPVLTNIVRLGPPTNLAPGGYSSWQFPPSGDAKKVFHGAVASLLGVNYEALGDSSQVVAGTNYCFLAKATVVYPGATPNPAVMSVFQPLKGDPIIREIHMLRPAAGHAAATALAAE